MEKSKLSSIAVRSWHLWLVGLVVVAALVAIIRITGKRESPPGPPPESQSSYQPRGPFDVGGYLDVQGYVRRWDPLSLEDCSRAWKGAGYRLVDEIDETLAGLPPDDSREIMLLLRR